MKPLCADVTLFLCCALTLTAAESWSVESFPFEREYQERIDGMLERFAGKDVMDRSKAPSTCPDTGLPVLSWALEGETIISPYTGRSYVQPETGYFGPKARNEIGQIVAFGGDPLKHTLMYATARMMLDADDPALKAFLGIPGNLRQQYHFAAVNWARFWPLFRDQMGEEWNKAFVAAVAAYAEGRRPSDGGREHAPLRKPHDLVGDPDEHLGGGGTENHRTMWRSTALLYSHLFPEGSHISGHDLPTVREAVSEMFRSYARRLYTIGNGEYDSSIYYPYSIRAFLNLYDFSPDEGTRNMAKLVLDYYLASYGLKVFNGTMTGAQRRGYPKSHDWNDMDQHLWAWVGGAQEPPQADLLETTVHQITSSYRPNQVVSRLIRKEVALPFEAWINHPVYDMSGPGHHLEYYYQEKEFSLGSVQLSAVNNSGQQTTWVLAVRGDGGETVTITGGQPRWIQRGGHSPYDQYVQHKNTLIYMLDQTAPNQYGNLPERLERRDQILGHLSYDRYTARAGDLYPMEPPDGNDPSEWHAFLESGIHYAGTLLWIPRRGVEVEAVTGERVVMRIGKCRVVILPLAGKAGLHAPDTTAWDQETLAKPAQMLLHDQLLLLPGAPGGFVLEVLEAKAYRKQDFGRERLNMEDWAQDCIGWRLTNGRTLRLKYDSRGLRPRAFLDGTPLVPEAWEGRGHIDSPYLKIKDGTITISDGSVGYTVKVTDPFQPDYQETPPAN